MFNLSSTKVVEGNTIINKLLIEFGVVNPIDGFQIVDFDMDSAGTKKFNGKYQCGNTFNNDQSKNTKLRYRLAFDTREEGVITIVTKLTELPNDLIPEENKEKLKTKTRELDLPEQGKKNGNANGNGNLNLTALGIQKTNLFDLNIFIIYPPEKEVDQAKEG